MRYSEIAEMTVNTGGIEYEWEVFNALKSAEDQLPDIEVLGNGPTGGFNSHDKDLELRIYNELHYFEIKQNMNAQMGGTSIKIDLDANEYILSNPDAVDEESIPFYIEAAKTKQDALKNYIDFMRVQEPVDLHKNLPYKIPFGAVTKDAWLAAKDNGYLAELNTEVRFKNTDIISKLYNSKGVNYIQIGGAGLFYLGDNPLKLPVPKFQGEVNIEFRLGPSGSKIRQWNNEPIKVKSAGYRCQGRLKTKIKSRYTLDDANSIIELFTDVFVNTL